MLKTHIYIIIAGLLLAACNGKLPGADARKFPADPKLRVEQNMKAGKGFRLSEVGKSRGTGEFEFASSNELWRASLDILDFMPLVSVNYSGGIIITDWYSENEKDSIKITLRFLTNEIRSDAIDIKIFYKECLENVNCKISEKKGELEKELKREILKKALTYQEQSKDKNFKPYNNPKYN